MATEYVSVIEVFSSFGYPTKTASRLFTGEREKITSQAQRYFLKLCRASDSQFDEDNDKDGIQDILENGIYELKNYTVFLNTPWVD